MIVDIGADYTLLPYFASQDLKLDLKNEARKLQTFGIGGSEKVYLIKKHLIKIGEQESSIPLGIVFRDDIPPLLGRSECIDKFDVLF